MTILGRDTSVELLSLGRGGLYVPKGTTFHSGFRAQIATRPELSKNRLIRFFWTPHPLKARERRSQDGAFTLMPSNNLPGVSLNLCKRRARTEGEGPRAPAEVVRDGGVTAGRIGRVRRERGGTGPNAEIGSTTSAE